jgi:hypothetical protein
MFREALSAPARTDDAATTLFMGGFLVLVATVLPVVWLLALVSTPLALVLTPFAVFPPLVLRGYYVRTVRAGLDGDEAAPSFVRWSELVRDGAKSLLLSVGYLLPFGLLAGLVVVCVALLAGDVVAAGSSAGVATALGVVLGGVVTLGYGVVYLYLRPAALAVFAADGRLRGGFALRRVFGVARDGRYAGGWLRAVTVLALGVAIGAPTTLAVVGVFVTFYARVVAHVLYGRGAADVLGVDDDTSEGVETAPLADRPSEVSPSVQTGRTVGFVVGRSARNGDGADVTTTVEPDGSGEPTAADEADEAADPFVWGPRRTRDE